jgi:hypothetical protein
MSLPGSSRAVCTETQGGGGVAAGHPLVDPQASDEEEPAAETGSRTATGGAEHLVATEGALLTPRMVVGKPAKTSPLKNDFWNVLTLSSKHIVFTKTHPSCSITLCEKCPHPQMLRKIIRCRPRWLSCGFYPSYLSNM